MGYGDGIFYWKIVTDALGRPDLYWISGSGLRQNPGAITMCPELLYAVAAKTWQ